MKNLRCEKLVTFFIKNFDKNIFEEEITTGKYKKIQFDLKITFTLNK